MLTAITSFANRAITDSFKGGFSRRLAMTGLSLEELRKLTHIAAPLIMASLVTMSISITDVIMIGRLGTVELAAGAAASDFYSIFFYLAAGVIAATSPLISQARGKQQFRSIKSITSQGLLAGMLTGVPAALMVYHGSFFLGAIGVQQDIVTVAAPYSHMMAVAIFPMLATMSAHHFLSAHGKTRIILYVTACAMPVNIVGNYLLLYGNYSFPRLGLAGAGIATAITGAFMFITMVAYIASQKRLRRYWYLPAASTGRIVQFKEIFKIGLPIGICHVGEMGVFLFTTVTMGVFGAEVLAAHTIALRAAGVFYAVPLGYGQAATVRIGYLSGKGHALLIQNALTTIFAVTAMFGVILMLFILAVKTSLPSLVLDASQMTDAVLVEASIFLTLLALMQFSINLGTVGAGALRGFKDTRLPMIYSLVSYWGFGFAGAMAMAFWFGLEGAGIWCGLLLATIAFAVAVWWRIYRYYWQTNSTHPLTSVFYCE